MGIVRALPLSDPEKINPVSATVRLQLSVAPIKHRGLVLDGVGVAALVPKTTVCGDVMERFTVVLPVKVIGLVAQPELGTSVTVVLLEVSVEHAESAQALTVTTDGSQVTPVPLCSIRMWLSTDAKTKVTVVGSSLTGEPYRDDL